MHGAGLATQAGRPSLRAASVLVPCLRVQEIGVYERGKEHAYSQGCRLAGERRAGLLQYGWQLPFARHPQQFWSSSSDGLLHITQTFEATVVCLDR